MKWFWTSYIPFFTSPFGTRFWGSWKWFQVITLGQKHWICHQKHSLPCSEPKLQFHAFKLSLVSYSPWTLFLTFRSIWGSWKWPQIIFHTQKPGVRHQTQVSSMTRSKVTIYADFGPIYPFSAEMAKRSRHRYMGVKNLLCKKVWLPLDQYIPEHLLKPVNYQKVGKKRFKSPLY